jgi:subtilase family serine protease
MPQSRNSSRTRNVATHLLAFTAGALALFTALPANAAPGPVHGNTPRFVANSTVLNREDPSKVIEISLWLTPHNKPEMDQLAKDLYDPKSPSYRQFLKRDQIAAKFAPSAADAAKVKSFLESNGMKIVSVGPHNFYVRASGTARNIESALHVSLNYYQVRGQSIRANDSDPMIEGPAGSVVRHVSGLDTAEFTHPNHPRPTPPTSSMLAKTNSTVSGDASPAADFFSNICFPGIKTESYTTGGGYPKATFNGHDYGGPSSGLGCGYTPDEIQTAFKLKGLYAEGFDGTGQTIIIEDWCGSPTILSDANAFSKKFGLPKLTSANFSILEVPTKSTCAAPDVEINIDVEWAHAIAPGANILLLVPPSASFQDTDAAEFYAIDYDLGNVLSGSYGSDEFFTSTAELETEDLINEIGAITGISTNFSSGDGGDYSYGGFEPPSVSAPADSPNATAVGGTTLALNADNSIAWQTGWGNNVTYLDISGEIQVPPFVLGLNGGAGGGASGFFSKPFYQSALPGTARQLPDVSWLADPFTGGVIAISEPFQVPALIYTVYGGTSLACPMFSGLWAIANQEANGGPLGQAAPYLYTLPANTLYDIVPYDVTGNVTGSISTSKTASTYYHSWDLVGVPQSQPFYSALWDYPDNQDTTLLISFGTDSSLNITKGWDNVTGVGIPKGKAFADYFFVAPPPPSATTPK